MADELNGTSVFLEVFNTDTGLWAAMAGELTNTPTLTTALIEITNKSSASFTTFLEDQGRQSITLTGDWVFNSDVDFQFVRTAANNKSEELFRILRGPTSDRTLDQFSALVATASDASPSDDKVTSSFSLTSSDEFDWFQTLLLLKNSANEPIKNSANEQLYSRSG